MNILFLTHDPLYNEKFVNKLTTLGYETFCSIKCIEQLKVEGIVQNLSRVFSIILFDETISNNYIEAVMPLVKKYFIYAIRKSSYGDEQKENELLSNLGVNYIFNDPINLDDLREGLSKMNRLYVDQKVILSELDQIHLTYIEEKIIKHLISNNSRVVSRNELSKLIWHEDATQSHLSSLSNSVRSIKRKMEKIQIQNPVMTIWKKGYKINPAFMNYYDKISTDS